MFSEDKSLGNVSNEVVEQYMQVKYVLFFSKFLIEKGGIKGKRNFNIYN